MTARSAVKRKMAAQGSKRQATDLSLGKLDRHYAGMWKSKGSAMTEQRALARSWEGHMRLPERPPWEALAKLRKADCEVL